MFKGQRYYPNEGEVKVYVASSDKKAAHIGDVFENQKTNAFGKLFQKASCNLDMHLHLIDIEAASIPNKSDVL